MKVLIVGGGGREHAIATAVAKSDRVDKIYCAPGNAGIAAIAECVPIGVMEFDKLTDFAVKETIDLTIVAPDDPLVAGAADAFESKGLRVFGPRKNAAILEGSKAFSKDLMKKYNIPTAAYEVFDNAKEAIRYLKNADYPIVIKADGLALGKGVIICPDFETAEDGIKSIMEDKVFGESGNNIVIEEFLTGPEVSVLCFTDGKTVKPMVSSMDHKRALDNDEGLNTGGMGTIAPNPCYTKEVEAECMEKIFLPTINAMNKEGRTFKGCLYFGLMLTPKGAKVIEYNCRFGDPETQVVLPLLESDLLTIMMAVEEEKLAETEVKFSDGAACCVVVASDGYPKHYAKGFEVTQKKLAENAVVFHAGTKLDGGKLVTSGGRVLGVTAVGENLENAINEAYLAVEKVHFDNMYYRKDIGKKALNFGK